MPYINGKYYSERELSEIKKELKSEDFKKFIQNNKVN